jgi:hypothetical protein
MRSVTIVSDDRVGLLADVSYILGKSNINIDALFVDVVGGKAIISLEVKDPKKAVDVLARNGFLTTNPEALIVKAGSNAQGMITEMLEGERIKVTEFSVLTSDTSGGIYAIHVDKPRKASRMLGELMLGHAADQYGD